MQQETIVVAPKRRGYLSVKVSTAVLAAVLIVIVGFVHVVHGGGVGLTVCEKDGWSLSDTFVDLDDFIGKPLLANLDRAKVLRAMFACGTLERPGFLDGNGDRAVSDSRATETELKVRKYVRVAYPAWADAHPGKHCPTYLDELNEYMNTDNDDDAWGSSLRMRCTANGISVSSNGIDRLTGTPDDITAPR